MAAAQKTIIVNVAPQRLFEVICDYEAYPRILSDMEHATVIRRDDSVVEARFTLNLIKRVSYTLKLVEEPARRLSWTLVEGPFKSNRGSWTLDEVRPGVTQATYEVEVSVGAFVPKSIVNRLVEKSLPSLLAAFKAEAESGRN